MSVFISFLQLLRTDFTEDEQVIIACPSQEQISVLMTSLLMTSQPRSTRPSVSSSPPPIPNPSNQVPHPSSQVPNDVKSNQVQNEVQTNGKEMQIESEEIQGEIV
jgi:hypothetical protein